MSAAPLALFLTEFSRTSGSNPRGPRQVHKAPVQPPPQFDAEADIGPEFDAPADEEEMADEPSLSPDEGQEDISGFDLPSIADVDDDLTSVGDFPALDEADGVSLAAPMPDGIEDVDAGTLRAELESRHQEELAALNAAHEEAFAAARAEWAANEGERLASAFATAIGDLRDLLDSRIADALRPLMAAAVVTRVRTDLLEVIDRLISDPTRPAIRVRASEDLLAVLRSARPDAPIEWQKGDALEVTITTDTSTVESKLAAALADIATTEI